MQKCDSCGYLLFGDADSCKHCGAALASEAPVELVTAGAPVAAAPPVAAPPLMAPPPPPPIPPSLRPPAPELGRSPVAHDYWGAPGNPVAARPPRPPKNLPGTRALLIALIVIVSMAFGFVSVQRALNGDSLPAGTSEFVAGRGVPYASPDRTFDAQFPSTPTVEQRQIPVATSSATTNMAQVQTDDYEIVAASMVLPISIPANQVDGALHEILRAGVAATNGEVTTEKRVVVAGVAGVEVRAKVSDGYGARVMVLSSGNRIYMLGVHAKRGTDRLYDALVNSFLMH
jgi:hypothetical protein